MLTLADLHAENLILFEAISGSHAYGLATPQSDTDIKGVFYLPRRLYYGLDYLPQISDAGNDTTYYELGRFVELLLASNPTALELLAIKHGAFTYDALLTRAEALMTESAALFAASSLPDAVDKEAAIAALVAMREALYG
jgi:hypothetical protein